MTRFMTTAIIVIAVCAQVGSVCRADSTPQPILYKAVDLTVQGESYPWRLVNTDGTNIGSFKGFCAVWAPNGLTYAVVTDGGIDLVTPDGKTTTHLYQNYTSWFPSKCAVWSADGKRLAVPATSKSDDPQKAQGLLVIFDVTTHALVKSISVPAPNQVAWSHDSKEIIEEQRPDTVSDGSAHFHIIDTSTWTTSEIKFAATVVSWWALLPDDKSLLGVTSAAGASGESTPAAVSLLSLKDSKITVLLDAGKLRSAGVLLSDTSVLALSPDGTKLAVSDASPDQKTFVIVAYDVGVEGGTHLINLHTIYGPNADAPLAISWSPSGQQLATITFLISRQMAIPSLSIVDLQASKVSKIANLDRFPYDPMIVYMYFVVRPCLNWGN